MMTSLRLVPVRAALTASRSGIPARAYATKQPSASSLFYKQFSRPVAKVLLMAVFTYQAAYWSWIKLETDEIRAKRDATIAGLEAQVHDYEKSRAEAKDAAMQEKP